MVKLTQYAAKGGCACKIGPHILAKVLQDLPAPAKDSRVLVNMEGSDDAGVFKLSDDLAIVQTLDFFTPPVDDPRTFGRVAAANSLSDIYAMGGSPITAMNIVAFPVPLVEQGVLTEVLSGAGEVLEEAGVSLVGGHSVEDDVPKFGLSVTGVINPQRIWQNKGARVGDVLILTKPLGTGIMSTALKGDLFPEGTAQAMNSMTRVNKVACEVAQTYSVHACTDITGFSLLGHGKEMAVSSNVSIVIHAHSLPLFAHVWEAAQMGLVPAATYGNKKAIKEVAFDAALKDIDTWHDICFDPQTSGGLLFCVPATEGEQLVKALQRNGVEQACMVGEVVEKQEDSIYVTT